MVIPTQVLMLTGQVFNQLNYPLPSPCFLMIFSPSFKTHPKSDLLCKAFPAPNQELFFIPVHTPIVKLTTHAISVISVSYTVFPPFLADYLTVISISR